MESSFDVNLGLDKIKLTTITLAIATLFGSLAVQADQIPTPITPFSAGQVLQDTDLNTRFGNIEQTVDTNDTNFGTHTGDAAAHHSRYTDTEAANAAKAGLITQGECTLGRRVTGFDSSGNIVCSLAQNIITAPGASFIPTSVNVSGTCNPVTSRTLTGIWFETALGCSAPGAFAPVAIPDLASIVRLDCRVTNSSTATNMTVKLVRVKLSDGTAEDVVAAVTSLSGSNSTTITGNAILNPVQNDLYYYVIDMTLTDDNPGDLLQLHYCQIFLQ